MLLNAKKLSFLSLLLACAVILVILGGVLEFNTLFLLAGASFCVGIAIRESNIRFGFGFYIASILLSFLLAPNKLYCFTFAAMGLYIVLTEYFYYRLASVNWDNKVRKKVFFFMKFFSFNIIYIPILFFFPKLIFDGQIKPALLAAFILGGQAFLFIFDKAYNYFQSQLWGKLRGRLHL